MSIIGENIKVLRKAVGYSSVYKFATAVGLPEKRVDAWERGNGNPKVDDTIKVAKFFEIDLELLRNKSLSDSEAEKIAARLKEHNTKLHTVKYRGNSNGTLAYTKSGEVSMTDIITMSLFDLLKLQKEGYSGEMGKLIEKLIEYKQRIAELESENKSLLREIIEILKEKVK